MQGLSPKTADNSVKEGALRLQAALAERRAHQRAERESFSQ
jgi:hypothetical protein